MKVQQHSNQAIYNEEFLKYLLDNKVPYLDWIITIAFYTALHYVHTYLASIGITYEERNTHDLTLSLIADKLEPILVDYTLLYKKSRRIRYLQRDLYQIRDSDVKRYVSKLNDIKSYLVKQLGSALIPPPYD